MVALLAAVLAVAAQPAEQALPDHELRQALVRLAECHGGETARRVRTGTDAPEAIITAAFAACAERERQAEQQVVAQFGAADAPPLMANLRDHARQRMLQSIAEARGAAPVRRDGDESLAWGACARREGAARAQGTEAVDAVVAATRRACAAEEQAARIALTREFGAENADPMIAGLLANLETLVREIVANARASAP